MNNSKLLPQFIALALLAGLVWLVAYPLVLVLAESARGPAGWTLDFFRTFVSRTGEWRALWASLWIALASVALSAAIGIPLAFLFSHHEFPGRRLLGALVALPAVLPPLVGVMAFLFLYGETGFAARLVQAVLRLEEAPWRLEGAAAILLVHAYSMYVYFYLFVRAGLSRLDPSLAEAAAALGAGRWLATMRITLPLLRPALSGAALLTFMTSLASFSAPYIFGGGFRVMTTQIVKTRLNGDTAMAMVETVALTLLALAGLGLAHGTGSRSRNFLGGGSKGSGAAARRIARPGVRRVVTAAAWGLAALLLAPHATLLLLSLVPAGTWTVEAVPPAYTLLNYAAFFRDAERWRPLANSLWMASASTAAALGVALLAGWLAVRAKVRGAGAIETLLALPWAVPGTVFAIALATLFGVHAPWSGRVVLIGTVWLLPLAYLVRCLPIAGGAVLAGMRGLDPALEEAAASLGSSRWRTLTRVTLPLLRPALLAGASLAFVTGLGDFVTSIVLYTYETRPLSLEILGSLRQSDVGMAAAYGVLLMFASAVVFTLGAERKGLGS